MWMEKKNVPVGLSGKIIRKWSAVPKKDWGKTIATGQAGSIGCFKAGSQRLSFKADRSNNRSIRAFNSTMIIIKKTFKLTKIEG